jgi:hypothetical protein
LETLVLLFNGDALQSRIGTVQQRPMINISIRIILLMEIQMLGWSYFFLQDTPAYNSPSVFFAQKEITFGSLGYINKGGNLDTITSSQLSDWTILVPKSSNLLACKSPNHWIAARSGA